MSDNPLLIAMMHKDFDAMEDAINKYGFPQISYTVDNYGRSSYSSILYAVDDMEKLNFLWQKGYFMGTIALKQIFINACENNPEFAIELLPYIIDRTEGLDKALAVKNFDLVQFLLKDGVIPTAETIKAAIYSGNREYLQQFLDELNLSEEIKSQCYSLLEEYSIFDSISDKKTRYRITKEMSGVIKTIENIIDKRHVKFAKALDQILHPEIAIKIFEQGGLIPSWYYHECIKKGNGEVLEFLLSKTKNPTKMLLQELLLYSIERNKPEIIDFLLETGADANSMACDEQVGMEGAFCYTPIEKAVYYSTPDIIDLLLQRGAIPDFPELLRIAQKEKKHEIYRFLLEKSKDPQYKTGERPYIELNEIKRLEEKEELYDEKEGFGNMKTKKYCRHTEDLHGDPLYDADLIILFDSFKVGGQLKGECYSKEEMKELFSNAPEVYEMDGPPLGVSAGGYSPSGSGRYSGYRGPRGPNLEKPVYKLPWSGSWIDKSVVDLINRGVSAIILHRGLASIGSGHGVGQMAGQWGGQWQLGQNERGDEVAIFVEDGSAVPDERIVVYSGTESEL